MNKFIVPELYCPFPSQINQYIHILENYAIEWAVHFNLLADESSYQRLLKSKFFFLAAAAYPHSQIEELKIANDWLNWVFIWDDQCDLSDLGKKPETLKAFHKRFLEILNGAEPNYEDIPLAQALSNLRERTLSRASIGWFYHFVCGFEEWFHGYVQEANIRAQGIVPDIDTYMMIRRSSVGVNIFLTLTEFCHQLIIPDVLRNHNIVKKLKLMTGHIIAWCNDLFSASREISSGDVHNIVFVLHHHEKLSLEEAMKYAVEIHNKEVQSMINLEAYLPSFGEELDIEIEKYISGFHWWIRSNLNWYSHSGRYQNVESLKLFKC